MKSRRTVRIEDSIYNELTETAIKIKKDSIANQLEIAIKEYLAREKNKNDQNAYSDILAPIDKRIAKIEEHLLDALFQIKLDIGIILNLLLPLSTNYIVRTDQNILKEVIDQMDDIYEVARRKTVRQFKSKEKSENAAS